MQKQYYSLTNPQKSIYLTEEYYKDTNINNICGTMTIQIPVEFDKLILAIRQFVKQNDGCRIMFTKEEAKQYIAPYYDFPIEIIDVRSTMEVTQLANQIVSKTFKLYDSYLFSFMLYRFPDGHGGFIINMHHLISDSWTLGILVNEIISIYSSYLKEESYTPKEIDTYSYLNYIASEEEYKKGEKYKKDKAYWNDLFQMIPNTATIPSNIENHKEPDSIKAQREQLSISSSLLKKIKEFCTSHKVSLFNFLMAIYSIYIGRVSNVEDFCLGTPILNRSNYKEKNTIGMFINILPLYVHLNSQLSFSEFLSTLATNSMSLLRHQKYSYQTILEDLRKREKNLPGLYKIMISYQITKMIEEQDSLPHESNWLFNQTMADDIDIHIFDLNDTNELNIAYDYKLNRYTAEDMKKIHTRIQSIISQILDKETLLLSEIQIITPEEKQQLLYDFNNTDYAYTKEKTLAELFEEQVSLTPNQVALVFEGNGLTYQELNEKANQLALFLRQNEIKNNNIVGILMNRSLEMMIAILAVLKSGGAYVPIDPDYPADRIHYVLENSHCPIVLTKKELFSKVTIPCKVVDISLSSKEIYTLPKANLSNISKPEDLSYLIYTSGSTGKPKGVMLTQKALTNLTFYCNDTIPYLKNREYKSIVSVTTVSFDIFIFETLISLQRGLKLVIANHNEQTIPHFLDALIEKEKIEIIQTTPSRMQLFYNQKEDMPHLSNLKDITLAGEPLPITLKNNLIDLTHGRIYNGYGPSETTVFSTLTDVTNYQQITIGKALYNTQIYILDNYLNPCPIGIAGEIYIAGDGVGHGYMGNPELTQKSFIPNPFIPNTIMYKTGDIGIYLENGEILCLGRVDHQVKIRGLRIELEEIEKQMMQFSGISNSCVVKKVSEEGHEFLCAYYTATAPIALTELRQALKKALPNYMIPQYFIPLESFPYTPNGKIDKKLLPEPDYSSLFVKKERVLARNEIDSKLLAILSDLLKIEQISMDDSFYDLGGDSLSAIQLCSILYHQMQVQISVKDILAHPVMMELSDFIVSQLKYTANKKIKPTEKREFYPTSSAQKRIYYASEMKPNSVVYNIAGGLLLDKIPDITKLKTCLQTLVQRHASLRTYFDMVDGNLVQKIVENINFELKIEDGISSDIEKLVTNFVKPFNLHKAPLFRAELVLFENEKSLLLIDMHHSISDGTSLTILLKELCSLYNEETLPEHSIDYQDFAIWENSYLNSPSYEEDKQYWLEQFTCTPPVLDMPCSLPRSKVSSFVGESISIQIENDLRNSIFEMAKQQNITPYMLLLAAYFILLYKYTNQEDIVIGTPIMNREIPELENVLGMFVNNLALRSSIDSSLSIEQYFDKIKNLCLNSFKHQAYPFDELVKELKLKRETNRNPIFDTMFIYQNNGYPSVTLGNISTSYFLPQSHVAKFDLSLEVIPKKESLLLNFEYDTSLFTKEYIHRLSEHYCNLLRQIVQDITIPIQKIDILSNEEKNKLLHEFNNTQVIYNQGKNLIQYFEEQVDKNPEQTAIIFEDEKVSYFQLNQMANEIAHDLLKKNIKRNRVVSILLKRGIPMIASMLGVLKVGATYLLIDSNLPYDRILYMLEDSQSSLLITDSSMKTIHFHTQLYLDQEDFSFYSKQNPNCFSDNEDGFSVIYTSGSTGQPKGVVLRRLGVINMVLSYQRLLHTDECQNFLSMSAVSFDMFVVENFVSLLTGKTVILTNEEEQKIPLYTNQLIKKYNVHFVLTTPTRIDLLLANIANSQDWESVKIIQLGGEVFPSTLYNVIRQYSQAHIFNGYGPTEFTACCSNKEISDGINITIGTPFCNTKIYICDEQLNLCPIGVNGEICLSGDGIAKGYLNKPDLTQKVFVPNPFGSGNIYKTGDIGRYLPSGEIEYIGRKDFQIKIRGLRVELSEIEKQLLSYPDVQNCSVIYKKESSDSYIVAFFVSKENLDIGKLRAQLSKKLPLYMIPKYFIRLDNLPVNQNGKTDKKALMNYKITLQNMNNYVAPQSETQKLLCDIWSSLLNVPVGIDDDFFELGADSLLAIKFKTELLSNQIDIPYASIFQYTTVKQLADYCDQKLNPTTLEKIEKEDFSIINKALSNNTTDKVQSLATHAVINQQHNILLLGGNGFVGSHILYEFLQKDQGIAYCIIRDKNGKSAYNRLLDVLHFYFGNELDNLIGKRILIFDGDLTQPNFNLSDSVFQEITKQIDTVINVAAMVKHYGDQSKFETINIGLTKVLVEFCKTYHKRLLHISSTSVSGTNSINNNYSYKTNNDGTICFAENNLYIGQQLDNLYIKSKFEAEKIILEQIPSGLNAQILRLGNMTNRYCDGIFQINPTENAFLNRMITFLRLGYLPKSLEKIFIEFTPVDLCACAIIKILQYEVPEFTVFHLYNGNYITMQDLVRAFQSKDISLDFIEDELFEERMHNLLQNPSQRELLSGIINDIDSKKKFTYTSQISMNSEFTKFFLYVHGFNWPKIDITYIENYIKYLKQQNII